MHRKHYKLSIYISNYTSSQVSKTFCYTSSRMTSNNAHIDTKVKVKKDMLRSIGNSPENPWSQS